MRGKAQILSELDGFKVGDKVKVNIKGGPEPNEGRILSFRPNGEFKAVFNRETWGPFWKEELSKVE